MPCPASASWTSDVAPGASPAGLDVNGRVAVVETRLSQQAETNQRVDAEIARLREFRHAAANIVNGWSEFERAVEEMRRAVSDLQTEVKALRAANDKLQGPGGAIEQLNALAENRRFWRRLFGVAAWAGGAVAAVLAFLQAVAPHVRWPWSPQ